MESLKAGRNRWILAFAVLIGAVLTDQLIKIYVKTHFIYGESYTVFDDWFKLYFIENEGMAFGMKLFGGGKVGKLVLTFFRILVSAFGIIYLISIIKGRYHRGLIISLALVLAGAIGNIIDSIFYGVVFDDINGYVATWFEGHVVDMFYAPIYEGVPADWIPFIGGQHFVFFAPIWNFADACITVGVAIMIIAQKWFTLPSPSIIFSKETSESNTDNSSTNNL